MKTYFLFIGLIVLISSFVHGANKGAAKKPVKLVGGVPLQACKADFAHCKAKKTSVGKGADQREYWIVEIDQAPLPNPEGENASDEPCVPKDVYRFAVKGKTVEVAENIFKLREGGCIGSSEQDVSVDVKKQTVDYIEKYGSVIVSGGSNLVWSSTEVYSVIPEFKRLRKSYQQHWRYGGGNTEFERDEVRKLKTVKWFTPECRPDLEDEQTGFDSALRKDYAYDAIPLNPAATAQWKKFENDLDGLLVSSLDRSKKTQLREGGYVTFGEPAEREEGHMKVLASNARNFFVEVELPRYWAATNWVNSDHLEFWASTVGNGEGGNCVCLQKKTGQCDVDSPLNSIFLEKPLQWGLPLNGEKIIRAAGKPSWEPKVERVEFPQPKGNEGLRVRYHLSFPKELQSVTVALSFSDAGKKQKRVIATSQLKFNDPRTLGWIEEKGEYTK